MKHKQLWLTAAIMTMLGTNMSFAAVQIGDNSIAEGNQAISTGINSIAVGTNAVATGDNLTGPVIKQKLAENQAKLAEIERLTKLVNDETIDFNQKHAIYNRVEAAKKKIAENNALIQNTLQPNLDTANNNYNAFKPEYDETVRQMNERLSYINKLNFSLLTTDPNGLDTLATELKQKSEDGFPNINNDLNFYKTYIQNYIKAKGDLENIKADNYDGKYAANAIMASNVQGIDTNNKSLEFISRIYITENSTVYGIYNGNPNYMGFDFSDYLVTRKANLNDQEYANFINTVNQDFSKAQTLVNDLPLNGALNQDTKNNILDTIAAQKERSIAMVNAKHEQYLYDSLKNSNPTQALQHLQNKLQYEQQFKVASNKVDTLSKSSNSWTNSFNSWYKTNVKDVESSNTLTVTTLSNQYKAAIADKQAKLDDLNAKVQAADAAVKAKQRENAQLQPTQQELDDAAAAARVKAKLDADQAALDDAKRTLALNNLKNIGTNAISVGNNSLVTGKNAIGIGTNGLITGEDAIGIGRDNTITGVGSVTIGSNNSIQSNNAFAIGNNINIPTGMNNAVVIGNNSTAKSPTTVDGVTADATVSIGSSGHERQLVNVAKGEVSSTSTDAINGSQLYKVQLEVDTKANTGLDNITDAGKTVIRNVAKSAVKVVNGQNTTVTTGTDGDTTTYAVNVSSDAIKDVVQPELDKKANTDASNLTGADVSKWQEKLGTGTVTNGNTGLVTGDTIYKEIAKTNTALDTKANTGLDNITDAGKTVIRNVAKGAVKVVNGQNTTVTTGTDGDATTYAVNVSSDAIKDAVQPELNKKANTDASNLTGTDVSKWQEKLGTGTVAAGNTGLVTGDTVYNVVRNSAGNPLAVAYDSIAKDHISLTGQNGTIISNVRNGQVAEGSMDAVNGGQLFETNSRINQLGGEVKHVGAISAALAGLHPQEYDDHYKLSIAAARGAYDGASAFALGAFYRPNSDLMFNAASTVSSGKKAYTVGVSYKFGTSGKQSVLAENAALQDKVNKLESMMNTIVNSPLFKLSKERSTFPDVPSERWDAPAVETLHANGIIQGYPDGTFKGDQPMSRSEYAKMIYELVEKLTTPNN